MIEPGMGIGLVFIVSLLVLLALFGPMLRGGARATYAAKPLMTRNEQEFIGRLERALPECRIHSQVSMGAILKPAFVEGSTKRSRSIHRSVRNRFAQKIVDFVVEDRQTGSILALVELDDRTHDATKDGSRDAMTRAAGYTTIRWHSRRRPTREEIRQRVLGTL